MQEGNEAKIFPLNKIQFVANVTVEGSYKIKELVPFRNKLYLLIERPDCSTELYYVNEEHKRTDLVEFKETNESDNRAE